MQANNITAGEEANDQENTAQEIHNNLEQGNSPKQQRKAQKKEEKNNSSGITAVELTSNKIHLNEVMVGVAVGGKDGGSKKNPTNIQVGVTKGVNLPHVMHEGDQIDQKTLTLEPMLTSKINNKLGSRRWQ